MVKKAQANIIVVVLIILIVLVSVGIVWNIVNPLISQKSEEVDIGKFTINLEIQSVVVFENGVSTIRVNRKSGKENLDGLKFVFYDEEGNTVTRDKEIINELETKTYSFSAITEIDEFGKISKVGVAPVINGNLGMVIESEPDSVLKIPSGVISWWRFDDLNDFVGGNTCTISDGGGVSNGVLNGEVDCSANGLNFNNNMGISFWIKGNSDGEIMTKGGGYKISVESKKIKFVSGSQTGTSEEELGEDWNHVVISISPAVSKIYINNAAKLITINPFSAGDENLVINGEVDDVMIFNKSITNPEGIYNIQKKD